MITIEKNKDIVLRFGSKYDEYKSAIENMIVDYVESSIVYAKRTNSTFPDQICQAVLEKVGVTCQQITHKR